MRIKEWKLPQIEPDVLSALEQELSLPPVVCRLLAARGYHNVADARAFMADGSFCDPYLLPDMEKAVLRIRRALAEQERITIFGDYDCDGITSTAVLYQYLETSGADVNYYIPQREEGYGLTREAIDLMHQNGVTLIITVDNGISALEEVDYAAEKGIDVVVTDHHRPRPQLPNAVAVVDPHRVDCPQPPYVHYEGVGVVFKLICALEEDDGSGVLEQYGDLIALGTLADVVELTGENRSIVRQGLAVLEYTNNIGISALMDEAGVQPGAASSQNIAFTLAPRINAAGRMGDVDLAVDLLLSEDEEQAADLAHSLGQLNDRRKQAEAEITADISALIASDPSVLQQRMLVLAGEGWHMGVIGIVASKLTERYGKPCLLLALNENEARGSGRSIEGFSLIDAIAACSDKLTRFGGHPLAAGLSLPVDDVEAFRHQLLEYCRQTYPVMPLPVAHADCEISPAQITIQMLDSLKVLEPFGEGNPGPVFLLNGCVLDEIRPVGEGRHLSLRLRSGGSHFSAMMFGTSSEQFSYKVGEALDMLVQLVPNEYAGERRVTIKVMELRPSGAKLSDI
ncbi:MAG: single-stranded-DNA-specific exonuclease RecJ, partial [Oscillospiraceae bacterium]|nr:single-stranded-DNA-specific exonuclease RecJ [Oscillospiraceae bacterium]